MPNSSNFSARAPGARFRLGAILLNHLIRRAPDVRLVHRQVGHQIKPKQDSKREQRQRTPVTDHAPFATSPCSKHTTSSGGHYNKARVASSLSKRGGLCTSNAVGVTGLRPQQLDNRAQPRPRGNCLNFSIRSVPSWLAVRWMTSEETQVPLWLKLLLFTTMASGVAGNIAGGAVFRYVVRQLARSFGFPRGIRIGPSSPKDERPER